MTGAAVVMFVLAFLPALLPLSQGRIAAAIGVGLLCVCAAFALPFLVLPGVVLWFIALFIGMWSANGAKQDRQHKALLQTISARQGASGDPEFNARCRSHIRRFKPAFSNRMVYEANVNGERRRFWAEWEAVDFVASRIGASTTTPQLTAPATPTESYKGVRYVVCSDHSVTAHTPSGTEAFPSMYAFRTWADGQISETPFKNTAPAALEIATRVGNHGTGSVINQGTYAGYLYYVFSNGAVVSRVNDTPHTWANETDFQTWARQHQKAVN